MADGLRHQKLRPTGWVSGRADIGDLAASWTGLFRKRTGHVSRTDKVSERFLFLGAFTGSGSRVRICAYRLIHPAPFLHRKNRLRTISDETTNDGDAIVN
jgi:hypothetical protein